MSLKVERVLVGARNVWRQRGKKGKKAKLPINFSVRWEAVSSYLDLAVCKKKKNTIKSSTKIWSKRSKNLLCFIATDQLRLH